MYVIIVHPTTLVIYVCINQVHPTTLVIPIIHTVCVVGGGAYLVLTLCGLALRSTRMTRPRVQRTSP